MSTESALNPWVASATPGTSATNKVSSGSRWGREGTPATVGSAQTPGSNISWDTEDFYQPSAQGGPAFSPSCKLHSPESGPVVGAGRACHRSTEQYIELARPLLVAKLTGYLKNIAAHSNTPTAGLYVAELDKETRRAVEQLFDDGYLSLVLAVRNALCVHNAWMRYSAQQFGQMLDILVKYGRAPHDRGRTFRKAVLELKRAGFATSHLPEVSQEEPDRGEAS